MTASLWWGLRTILRLMGVLFPVVGPFVASKLASLLPCSVPGYGGAASLPVVDPVTGKKSRVAVVGGGISGCACAYSLTQAGYDVTVYESREVLGGNAQVADYPHGDKTVPQDLSVVYWAPEYYRNYTNLVRACGFEPAEVEIPYVIHTNVRGKDEWYTQPGSDCGLEKKLQPSMEERYTDDLKKYDGMISSLRRITSIFNWCSDRKSFYGTNSYSILPFCSPLNYIGFKTCAVRLYGISEEFYEEILKPFHALSLSTMELDPIPATAYVIVDDIMPLHYSRKCYSWGLGNSRGVFQKATEKCDVKLDTRVRQVKFVPPGKAAKCAGSETSGNSWRQIVTDDKGAEEMYDRVVMACPPGAAASILRPKNWIESCIFAGVSYHDDFARLDWKDWLECPVHQEVSCLPEQHRQAMLEDGAFLIDIDKNGRLTGGVNIEFTHNLGAWSPTARAMGLAKKDARMFMSQALNKDKDYSASELKTFSAPRGHPSLTTTNMVITQMLHLIQGRRGVYYCSNWTSPGNGHDLACTSGLCVAGAIGAPYPFEDPDSRRDWRDCRRFMNI